MYTKRELRQRLRAARSRLDDDGRAAAASRLAAVGLEWAQSLPPSSSEETLPWGKILCSYLPVGSEPDSRPLNRALSDAGFTVLVPVCEPEFRLSWAAWADGDPLVRSMLVPVDEPAGARFPFSAVTGVRGIVLPALAMDTAGLRLGQGGGYYDRFLDGLGESRPPTVAMVYDDELVPVGELPADPWDATLSGTLTPGGYHAAGLGA